MELSPLSVVLALGVSDRCRAAIKRCEREFLQKTSCNTRRMSGLRSHKFCYHSRNADHFLNTWLPPVRTDCPGSGCDACFDPAADLGNGGPVPVGR